MTPSIYLVTIFKMFTSSLVFSDPEAIKNMDEWLMNGQSYLILSYFSTFFKGGGFYNFQWQIEIFVRLHLTHLERSFKVELFLGRPLTPGRVRHSKASRWNQKGSGFLFLHVPPTLAPTLMSLQSKIDLNFFYLE